MTINQQAQKFAYNWVSMTTCTMLSIMTIAIVKLSKGTYKHMYIHIQVV